MRRTFELILRLVVAAVFLWAAFAKALAPSAGTTVYAHWIAEWPALRFLLPGVEAALGAWILVGLSPRVSTLATITLLAAFSGILLAELGKEIPKPCGCMGPLAAAQDPAAIRMDLSFELGRNILMMAALSYLFMAASRRPREHTATAQASGEAPINTNA